MLFCALKVIVARFGTPVCADELGRRSSADGLMVRVRRCRRDREQREQSDRNDGGEKPPTRPWSPHNSAPFGYEPAPIGLVTAKYAESVTHLPTDSPLFPEKLSPAGLVWHIFRQAPRPCAAARLPSLFRGRNRSSEFGLDVAGRESGRRGPRRGGRGRNRHHSHPAHPPPHPTQAFSPPRS